MKNFFAVLSLASAFLFLAVSSKAVPQSSTNNAQLTGTLTDPSGAGIAGVELPAQSAGPATQMTATSAPDGSYSISLPPGHYRVRFVQASFAAREITVSLAAGESRTLNLRLELER